MRCVAQVATETDNLDLFCLGLQRFYKEAWPRSHFAESKHDKPRTILYWIRPGKKLHLHGNWIRPVKKLHRMVTGTSR